MKKQLLVLAAFFFVASNAQALFELRAGYGVQTPADDEVGTANLKSLAGFNLDGIVELPLLPFGFGLRYENMASEVENIPLVGTADASFERTSLLINYRFIDLFAYAGVIGTIGFVNDYKIEIPGATSEYDANLTYSVGAEAGVSLGLIMIGGELGYMMADLEGSGGSEIDLSGVYAKALVGVGF